MMIANPLQYYRIVLFVKLEDPKLQCHPTKKPIY